MLATGKRIPNVIDIIMGNYLSRTKQVIKYLGVQLDNNRKFSLYLEKVYGKTDTLMGAIRILLPNVNRSTDSVRKFYFIEFGSRWCFILHRYGPKP